MVLFRGYFEDHIFAWWKYCLVLDFERNLQFQFFLFLVWFGALSFWEQIFGFLKISGFEDFSKYFQHDLSSLRLDLVPNIASNYNLKLFIKLVVFNKCTMSKIKYRVFIVMCSQLKLMQLFFDPIKLGESSTQFFFHEIDKLRKEKDCCKLVPRLQLPKLISFSL